MLEMIVMTLLLCTNGQLDCTLKATDTSIIVQVCNTQLGDKDGRISKFMDRPDPATGEAFTLIIQDVNCETL